MSVGALSVKENGEISDSSSPEEKEEEGRLTDGRLH